MFFTALVSWLVGTDVTEATGKLWFEFHLESLNLFQVVVQRYLYAPAWDGFIVPHLLLRPFWETATILFAFFLILGGAVTSLGTDRRRR